MKPKVIKSEREYKAALSKVESLMDATTGSSAEADLELWSLLVESYEREHFPIEAPHPVDAIRFRMEQQGLRPVDLQRFIKSKSHLSEVLHGRRSLTLSMIRALADGLKIPAEILIQESRQMPAAKPRRRPVAGDKRPKHRAA